MRSSWAPRQLRSSVSLDAKFVPDRDGPAAITRKLAGGVHQVTRYCDHWDESYGFLLTFVDSAKRIVLDVEEVDGLRSVNVVARLSTVSVRRSAWLT